MSIVFVPCKHLLTSKMVGFIPLSWQFTGQPEKYSSRCASLQGVQRTFPHHLVTSDFSGKLNTSIVHYEWKWDLISFLPEGKYQQMQETLKNLGDLWLHQPDLSELQYLTCLGSVQASSAAGSSTSAWAFNIARGAFIISGIVILVCLCFWMCQSRCSCCSSRHQQHQPAPEPEPELIVWRRPPTAAENRLGAGQPGRSPRLAHHILSTFKRTPVQEPTIRYHSGDEAVQLQEPPDTRTYCSSEFRNSYQRYQVDDDEEVSELPHYSTLPRTSRAASHGELARQLSTLSQ
jgi:hypothetical protein